MKRLKSLIVNNVALVGLLLLLILGTCVQTTFLSFDNLRNLLRSASITGMIAVGTTFVILCGSIDLSVGAVFAASGFLMLYCSQYSIVLALTAPLLFAVAVGFLNGVLINKLFIPAFIGTLATQLFVRGLVQMMTGETTYKVASVPAFLLAMGRENLFGFLPVPFLLFVLAVLVTSYILKRRFLGRSMYIVGGNQEAAGMMGVSVFKTTTMAHILCAVFAALGGMIYTARVGVASPLAGTGYEMYAIAAVVIGGAQLNGGVGKMSGSFIGALIMASFSNIFNLQSVLKAIWEDVVVGVVLLIVILAQALVTIRGGKNEGGRLTERPS